MSSTSKENSRPHAVCVPFPAQGHISPMLQLARLLHQNGFHITFVNTEYNHNRLLRSIGPDFLTGLPTFQFETIPDGLPPSDADSTQDIPSLFTSTKTKCLAPFRDLLSKLNTKNPAVTCIVSDCIMSFTLQAAQELGIPDFLFWTASACGFIAYLHFRPLVEKGVFPLKDASYLTNGYMETEIDCIPGLEGLRLKNLPSFVRTTEPDDVKFNFAIGELENACNGSAVIFNTFDELESEVLEHLSSILPNPIYTVGPLLLLLQDQGEENAISSIKSNLWKEQLGCLEWLDLKQPESVVYVSFGSVTIMTPEHLVEFAWALANSKREFLWVIRPDLVIGESAILPAEFLVETKDRGLLASWCPQEKILSHPAIGVFLTHNGWNSTVESLCGGVPMICWPFFAEQQTNSWFCCNKWGIGIQIGDGTADRNEIERVVDELMNGEKGKELKKKALEWKNKARLATSPSGSSYINLENLINKLLLSSTNQIK